MITNEFIAKALFDDKDCSIATEFEYGTPEVETMTSEERLNKSIENEKKAGNLNFFINISRKCIQSH